MENKNNGMFVDNTRLYIRVTKDQRREYKDMADKRGVGLSESVRQFLNKECKKWI